MKNITLFISSTFTDMEAERDCIKNYVVPKLEETLLQQQICIKVIDLRWGINTSDVNLNYEEKEAQILKVCFDEINRSRPFFIALLGDRYGWIPPESKLNNTIKRLSENDIHLLGNQLDGKSITEMEIIFGALCNKASLARSLFYFKTADYSGLTETQQSKYIDRDSILIQKRKSLKKQIIETCNKYGFDNNIRNYYLTEWDKQKSKFVDLNIFENMIYEHLLSEIMEELRDSCHISAQNWYEKDIISKNTFIYRNIESFSGRKSQLKHLHGLINSKQIHILTSFSGGGKSAIMCKLCDNLIKEKVDNRIILFHSAGISYNFRSVERMLQSFNRQICLKLGIKYTEIYPKFSNNEQINQVSATNDEFNRLTYTRQLTDKFLQLTSFAQQQNIEILILIDAWDRFNQNNALKYFTFIPSNTTVIISSISETTEEFKRHLKNCTIHKLDVFSYNDARNMIEQACLTNYKSIYERVLNKLLSINDHGVYAYSSPLWVSLATNVLFSLDQDDFTSIRSRNETDNEDKIENYLLEFVDTFPTNVEELFILLIKRAAQTFGENLTWKIFKYIAITQDGLREKDLSVLLEKDWDELQFAALRRWFSRQLIENTDIGQWYFAHNKLTESLKSYFSNDLREFHSDIASYLLRLDCEVEKYLRKTEVTDKLRINETMYHLINADMKYNSALYYSRTSGQSLECASKIIIETIACAPDTVDWLISLLNQDIDNYPQEYICRYFEAFKDKKYYIDHLAGMEPVLLEEESKRLMNKYNLFKNYTNIQQRLLEEENLEFTICFTSKILPMLEQISHNDRTTDWENVMWFSLLAKQYRNLCLYYEILGELDKAEQMLTSDLKISSEAQDAYEQCLIYIEEFSMPTTIGGRIYIKIGDIDKAKCLLFKDLEHYVRLFFSNEKKDIDLRINFLKSIQQYVNFCRYIGDIHDMEHFVNMQYKYAIEISETEFKNLKTVDVIAAAYEKHGDLKLLQNNYIEAKKDYNDSLQKYLELTRLDPNNLIYKAALALSYNKNGVIQSLLGNTKQAIENHISSILLYQRICNENSFREEFKLFYALSNMELGKLYLAEQNYSKSEEYLFAGYNIIKPIFDLHSMNCQVKECFAKLCGSIYSLFKATNKKAEALIYGQNAIKLWMGLYELTKVDRFKSEAERIICNYH